MQGTFSMAFRGRKADIVKLLVGAESLREEEPYFWKWWHSEQNLPESFDALLDDAETGLVVDEDWGNASQMEGLFLDKLRSFAPALEAAFRSSYDDPDVIAYDYFASGAKDAVEAEAYVEEDMIGEDEFPTFEENYDEDGNEIGARKWGFSPEKYSFIQHLWALPE